MGSTTWDDLWTQAGESSGPLPPAEYDFQIQSAEHRSTQAGKDMYVIKAIVTNGAFKGRMVWNNFVVSPESQIAMEIFFRQMTALGLDGTFWKSRPSDDDICGRLKGTFFRGGVGVETYNGTERNTIKSIKSLGGAGGASASRTAPPPPPPAPAPSAQAPAAPAPAPAPAAPAAPEPVATAAADVPPPPPPVF